MDVTVENLFSYPVVTVDIGQALSKLFENEGKTAKWVENIHHHANKNYVSKDLNVLKRYPDEYQFLLNCVEMYKNEIFKWHSVDLKITTSWMTKTEHNGFSSEHCHRNSVISGVAYDEANGFNVGELCFQSPKFSSINPCSPTEFTSENCSHYSVAAKPNRLILFESTLIHYIGKHLGKTPRISLAFNTFPDGQVGVSDSSMFIKIGGRYPYRKGFVMSASKLTKNAMMDTRLTDAVSKSEPLLFLSPSNETRFML